MSITTEQAAAWFAERVKNTPMPGAREMFEIAATAIREKAERENPVPLTIEELRQMDGEPVWVYDLEDKKYTGCFVIDVWGPFMYSSIDENSEALMPGNECFAYSFLNYGKEWIAYRHKPKEASDKCSK